MDTERSNTSTSTARHSDGIESATRKIIETSYPISKGASRRIKFRTEKPATINYNLGVGGKVVGVQRKGLEGETRTELYSHRRDITRGL